MGVGNMATMMLGGGPSTPGLGPAPTAPGGALAPIVGKLMAKAKPKKAPKNPALAALGAATPRAAGIFGF